MLLLNLYFDGIAFYYWVATSDWLNIHSLSVSKTVFADKHMNFFGLFSMFRNFVFCIALVFSLSTVAIAAGREDASDFDYSNVADRLSSVQVMIDANAEARSNLRTTIKEADQSQLPDLQLELDELNDELKKLNASFEQIAIGTVDVNFLEDTETKFDWKEEITLILQPIMDNLKALTDKPRKVSYLTARIDHKTRQQKVFEKALDSIEESKKEVTDKATAKSLAQLEKTWERLKDNNTSELELAEAQLAGLQNSDVSWWVTLRNSAEEFFSGRGLTLLIAFWVAIVVWLIMRAIMWLFQLRVNSADAQAFRTRRRLVQYGYRALVTLLIIVAVIAVFYIRGDLLLLGLSIIATATIALGLRQAVPRFISEAQLLLNVGGIREQERVIFNGLPWLVASINMYSILRNPELSGVLRLPLRDLEGLISRPASNKESWFPSNRGDLVLLDGDQVMEVINQTPEVVELRDAGGSFVTVSSADFYNWNFKNLSRGESFGVAATFGVDYQLQSISLSDVPSRFRAEVSEALAKTDIAHSVKNVMVELSSAGSSSLDYLVYVTMKSDAAKSYMRIRRIIQQTCVAVCTEENWGIPFPQMTVHKSDPAAIPAEVAESK